MGLAPISFSTTTEQFGSVLEPAPFRTERLDQRLPYLPNVPNGAVLANYKDFEPAILVGFHRQGNSRILLRPIRVTLAGPLLPLQTLLTWIEYHFYREREAFGYAANPIFLRTLPADAAFQGIHLC